MAAIIFVFFIVCFRVFPDLQSRCKFVSLQIVMKSLITKVFAALLVVWYLVGIIGFGMHTCSASGRSFVVSFIEGTACSDIHADHMCTPSSCCSHDHCRKACCAHEESHSHGRFSFSASPCCSNDYQMLDLTGMVVTDDTRDDAQYMKAHGPAIAAVSDIAVSSILCRSIIRHVHEPDSGVSRACDGQALLSVWRI